MKVLKIISKSSVLILSGLLWSYVLNMNILSILPFLVFFSLLSRVPRGSLGMNTAGYEYFGKEMLDVIVRPGVDSTMPRGIRIIYTDGSQEVKETFMGGSDHALVGYQDGFQGGNSSSKWQKKFELGEFKSEQQWSKQDYLNLVQSQSRELQSSFQNSLEKNEYLERLPENLIIQLGGINDKLTNRQYLMLAEWEIQQSGIARSIFNLFYLGSRNKVCYEGGTFPNKQVYQKYDSDIRFNQIDGLWEKIFQSASTSPGVNEIQKVDLSNSAVSQVDTLTLTGSSGSALIDCCGLERTVTFSTDLSTSAENFIDSFSLDYGSRDIKLSTTGSNDIIFESMKKGLEFDNVVISTLSGDLSGSVANTTANVSATEMSTDEAATKMSSMLKVMPESMRHLEDDNQLIFLSTGSWIRNYKETLGVNGSDKNTSEQARAAMVSGIPSNQLSFNGIPIYPMRIDHAISSYFGGYSPHRCILTTASNLVLVLSSAGKFGESALWWNKDENQNRTRTQLQFGADYWLPEYMVVAYQSED